MIDVLHHFFICYISSPDAKPSYCGNLAHHIVIFGTTDIIVYWYIMHDCHHSIGTPESKNSLKLLFIGIQNNTIEELL